MNDQPDKPDLLEVLTAQCPIILRDGAASYGFDVPPGWNDLVTSLALLLELHAQRHNPDLIIAQVKSKFGTLRFYVDGADDTAQQLIDDAEARSATICERCGAEGAKPRGRNWITTSCDTHANPPTNRR